MTREGQRIGSPLRLLIPATPPRFDYPKNDPLAASLAVYADGIGKRQPAGFAAGEAGSTPAPSLTEGKAA